MAYSDERLLCILDQSLTDFLSGWNVRRRVEVHHAITSAIYVLFGSDYNYDLAEKAVNQKADITDFYYAVKNEFAPHHLYYDWHDYSRCVSDFLKESNLEEQSNLTLLHAFINAFGDWVELQNDEDTLDYNTLLSWVEKEV